MSTRAKRIRTILCTCLALAVLLWASVIAHDAIPSIVPTLFAEQTQSERATERAHAAITGTTTFQSMSEDDALWQANATTQHVTLANPSGNSVDMAPHIHVDLNDDGTFEDDECVFNPIERDGAGDVVDWGLFIAPGKQVETITLSRPVPEGQYAAQLSFTALDANTHDETNPMSFEFTLNAQ